MKVTLPSKRLVLMLSLAAVCAAPLGLLRGGCSDGRKDVLAAAYHYPDGGGYSGLAGTGVPEDISHKGTLVLRKAPGGSYCCGFTFAVFVRAAAARGLLADLEAYDLRNLQKEWYGATAASRERQLVYAMERAKVGRRIDPWDAKPGDFVAFSRDNRSGHSVVFLDWVREDNVIVGFKYRSSQPSTGGIGERTEYFTTSGRQASGVIPRYFFVGRLN
jgi:hypothetical protein